MDELPTGHFITGTFPSLESGTCEELVRDVSVEETKEALRGMGTFKASGPNGYQAIFIR